MLEVIRSLFSYILLVYNEENHYTGWSIREGVFVIIDFIGRQESRKEAHKFIKNFDSAIKSERLLENVPEKLYRYTSLNEYVLDNIEKKEVTVTSPILFNDTFDTRWPKEFLPDDNPKIDSDIGELVPCYEKRQRDVKDDELGKLVQKSLVDFPTRIFRVACFTTTESKDTFWGMYADNSKGICIGYKDLKKDYFYPIVYSEVKVDTSKISDPYGDQDKFKLALLLSTINKKKDWSAEEEWRFLLAYDWGWNDERFGATPASIDCIYLGEEFIEHWKEQKKRAKEKYDKILTPFLKKIQEQNIPLKVMEKSLHFGNLTSRSITIKEVLDLIEVD
ncbi:TPA: DUF2971 domain-containing protein [Listeria monocytogenes]|nr:DUF2971 domain-containing protein [Listeria monocytogenes]